MIENVFQIYFDTVKRTDKRATEITHRTALENLLNEVKADKSFNVYQEPTKTNEDKGKPDFQVFKTGLLIGYLETKPVNTDLDRIIDKNNPSRETKQLYRYLTVSPTLILTNYTDFILFQNGVKVKAISFFNIKDKKLEVENITRVTELFGSFFLSKPQQVTSPEKLSGLLAERTKIFKDLVYETISSNIATPFKDKLMGSEGLYEVLKKTLIDDLSLDEFADAYAQTITYGLILARLNSTNSITAATAPTFIPKSVGTIRELFKTIEIEDIPLDIGWIIDAIIVILNSIDRKRFDEILSFKKSYGYEDPYVYFYEKFLAEYDKAKRKAMGVYYTPIPVVWYIVRSINQLLKKEFQVDGLKEPNVTVLDFATGTGTFLLEAYKKAIDDTDKGMRNRLIKEHLLKDFYGFEYLIAPYTVAHLKLSQFMKDNGYEIGDNERINVYLTDTLDNDLHKRYAIFPKMSEEGEEAYKIKMKKPILVVTGNPPYSNYSRNNKPWIKELIKSYKEGLDEQKINLDDDYIKFLRYAQWKIEQSGKGIIGVITNNSYIEGITHREMRHKLLQTFDKIYILNLHGNSNKQEPDKNVFDIKVGVAIVLFVKLEKQAKEKEVYYYSITEDGKAITRDAKYNFLMENDYSKLNWKLLAPKEPNYWFIETDERISKSYEKGVSITDIFKEYNSGIQTKRDIITIRNKPEELITILTDLINLENEEFRKKYRLPKDGRDWAIAKVKQDIVEDIQTIIQKRIKTATDITSCDWEEIKKVRIFRISYRPFDTRYTYFFNESRSFVAYPRYDIMKNFIEIKNNLGLAFDRQIVSKSWQHAFITDTIMESGLVSLKTREWTYVAPLYLDDKKEVITKQNKLIEDAEPKFNNPFKEMNPKPNFKDEFIEFLTKKYSFTPTPIEIFSYIYAILYAPTYRRKFYEMLQKDYPRIPFTYDYPKFKKLANLGQKLIDLHLLKIPKADSKLAELSEKGNDYIDKLNYDAKTKRLYINDLRYFNNIAEEIWNFEIGGYQVLYKWLNERKGSVLSYESQMQFKKIVYSIKETIIIMSQIDKIIKND
jgi:predicted helicase